MNPVWVTIVEPTADEIIGTWGMNVPGGMVLKTALGMVFVNGATIESIAPDQGYTFRSTATEEMQKAVQPIRELIAMFQGMHDMGGMEPPKSS